MKKSPRTCCPLQRHERDLEATKRARQRRVQHPSDKSSFTMTKKFDSKSLNVVVADVTGGARSSALGLEAETSFVEMS